MSSEILKTSSETSRETHSIARQLAREIRPDEMAVIVAGSQTCSKSGEDDVVAQ